MKKVLGLALALAALGEGHADAFCGFYVGGEGSKLFNNATQVVLMRDGTRTVLSMQNNYQGPPSDFAMVVPVPVVLQKENVKTLPKALFERVDQIASPRLVEYWEQDPCPPPMRPGRYPAPRASLAGGGTGGGAPPMKKAEVKIEAQFVVGEYDIVILSANDSMALDTWLRANHYAIPAGAEPYLRPYVAQGLKFFVAKVDAKKVTMVNGQADLSPLRFHYDSDQFNLPIRLGLINSQGSQDLIVNILAKNQRYDVTNYENVAIPTNIDVADATKGQFASFYTQIFEQTLAKHPRAVVTEYAWQATTCDPCPTNPLELSEIETLGADAIAKAHGPAPDEEGFTVKRRPYYGGGSEWVLTRLHVRYDKSALGDDLFFRTAGPIVGGREFVTDGKGKLEEGARPSSDVNNFQARYIIRHPWTGPIKCAHPQRGVWGGPPGQPWGGPQTNPAPRLGMAKASNVQLATLLKGTLGPETFLSAAAPTPVFAVPAGTLENDAGAIVDAGAPILDASPSPPAEQPKGGCAGCQASGSSSPRGSRAGSLAAIVALALTIARRRRR